MVYNEIPSGRPEIFYVSGSLVGGIAFWIISGYSKYPGLWQLIAVVLLSAAIYILIRYKLTVFRFSIIPRDADELSVTAADVAELDFTVERMRGKNPQMLCRLALSELCEIKRVLPHELRSAAKGMSLYKYTVDMSPTSAVLLVFESDGETIGIYAELSSEFCRCLETALSEKLS